MKKWTAEEIRFLKDNMNKLNNIELGHALDRSKDSVHDMIRFCKLKRAPEALKRFRVENGRKVCHNTESCRKSGLSRRIKLKFRDIFCKEYPELGNCRICISHKTVVNGGYPAIKRNGKCYKMKNYFWEQRYGKLSIGMCVLHKCDNVACVKLEHMFIGTQADNMRDAIKKGKVPQLTRNSLMTITR